MRRILQFSLLISAAFAAQANVLQFQIIQDRIRLEAQNASLTDLMEHFSAAGVRVEMDPTAQKTISGTWEDEDLEAVLTAVLSPFSYLLNWRAEPGPQERLIRLTGIRVFFENNPGGAKPFLSARRIQSSFDGRSRFMAREIVIGFAPGSSISDLHSFLARTGGTIIDVNTDIGVYRILLPEGTNIEDLADQLGRDAQFALAEPNYIFDLPEIGRSGASPFSGQPFRQADFSDGPVSVAVLDSGLIADEHLSRAVTHAFDATNPGEPLTADAVGHGTLMAQLAAGLIDPFDSPSGQGVPVVAVKAFTDDGLADSFTLMNAMSYAVQHSTGPVSLSWGSETPSRLIQSAVQYALDQGRPVFAAVGNENTGTPIYPAALPGVIGVAAADENRLADYSNRGGFVDIIAPGSAGEARGTSVATAYAAHLAGRYMQEHPNAATEEIVAALREAAGPDGILTKEAVERLLHPPSAR